LSICSSDEETSRSGKKGEEHPCFASAESSICSADQRTHHFEVCAILVEGGAKPIQCTHPPLLFYYAKLILIEKERGRKARAFTCVEGRDVTRSSRGCMRISRPWSIYAHNFESASYVHTAAKCLGNSPCQKPCFDVSASAFADLMAAAAHHFKVAQKETKKSCVAIA